MEEMLNRIYFYLNAAFKNLSQTLVFKLKENTSHSM